MKPERPSLYILDGFALIFRAHFAMMSTRLTAKDGTPTGAVFGFVRQILKILKKHRPNYFVVAWDSDKPTKRIQIYPEYKQHRPPAPEDLIQQIPIILSMVKAMALPSIIAPGFEADDIIASICHQLSHRFNITIVSGDKDLMQLINDQVCMIQPSGRMSDTETIGPSEVEQKLGVLPNQVVDYLALTGDASDNVPGVKGIGPKTAVQLIQEFKSLDGIYQNLDTIPKKGIVEKLKADYDQALLSRQLVTLYIDAPLDLDWDHLSPPQVNQEEARAMLKQYQLTSLLADELFYHVAPLTQHPASTHPIESAPEALAIAKPKRQDQLSLFSDMDSVPVSSPASESIALNPNYKAVLSKELWEELILKAEEVGIIAFDIESTSENPHEAEPIGISISLAANEGWYLPIQHRNQQPWSFEEGLAMVRSIAEHKTIQKVGQNIKYDYIVLRHFGITIQPIAYDTMLASYILDPERQSHGMDYLSETFLAHKTIHYTDIVPKQATLLDVDFNLVVQYAAEDADITLRLYHLFKPQTDTPNLYDLYYRVELPLITVLAEIELTGVLIDTHHFATVSERYAVELKRLEQSIYQEVDETFNINSTQALQRILFEKLKLPKQAKTKTGYSTNEAVLQELASYHAVPKLLLEYRGLTKYINTYLEALPKQIHAKTKRIHTSYNQTLVATGRLSSTHPNLQNIPIKNELGREIRKGFVPPKGYLYLSADYSQIELRILAHLSADPELIHAFHRNMDLHTYTASVLFKKQESEVTKRDRGIAKSINFGVIYGMGAQSLAKQIEIDVKEAKRFINAYFDQYRGVAQFIHDQKAIGADLGYVETLYHRRRYLKGIHSRNPGIRSQAERLAVNTPIQGSSADIIKLAMIKIYQWLTDQSLKSRMILQVHDELVFEVFQDEMDLVTVQVSHLMEHVVSLSVPLIVNVASGANWDEAH